MTKKNVIIIILFFFVFTVLYFSWLPDPNFGSEKYIPTSILNWCNSYFNLRTAIPFILIGFLMELIRSNKNSEWSYKIKGIIKHTFFSAFLVSIAEIGQHFILHRHPDLRDVLFGIIGSIIGAVLFHVIFNSRVDKGKFV